MLTKFRNKHMRKVLWFLAGVIIVAFGLSGAGSLVSGRRKAIAIIDGKKITDSEFAYYIKLSQLFLLLHTDKSKGVSRGEIEALALDFLVLLWKSNKDHVEVSDEEVAKYITKNIFEEGTFDKSRYTRFVQRISQRYNLALSERVFEEYIRDFIKKDMLIDENVNVNVRDDEIKEYYKKDTQEVKISYLFIPYEKGKKEEISQKSKDAAKESAQELLEILKEKKYKNLKRIARKGKLKVKEAGYFKYYDTVEDINLNIKATKTIFELEKGQIHPKALLLDKGAYIVQLKDKTVFDDEDFKEKKESYREKLKSGKELMARIQFLNAIRKESNLKVLPREQ